VPTLRWGDMLCVRQIPSFWDGPAHADAAYQKAGHAIFNEPAFTMLTVFGNLGSSLSKTAVESGHAA